MNKIINYTYFKTKNIVIQENKFPRLVLIALYRTCFFSLPPPTIQSDGASIKRHAVVNEWCFD